MHNHPLLSTDVQYKVQKWLNHPFDLKTQKEVQQLLYHDRQKLIDAFYTDLSFGTAGLRGLMGVGTNRINRYTIAIATQGLANYILKIKKKSPYQVAVAYDSRHDSEVFAQESSRVLAANGIKVFLSYQVRPSPFLAFVCRYHDCIAAIMITASHNPPEYNGYKVYWRDGGQIVSPHDTGIIQEVNRIVDIESVQTTDLSHPLIHYMTSAEDTAYLQTITALQNLPEQNQTQGHQLNIVFANLHGTGITLLPQALQAWGFTKLIYVEEQKQPNPDFPTAKNPNPELKEALHLGIKKLLSTKSDLLIATDPDADRVGAVSLQGNTPVTFDGNQIAALCLYHLLETFKTQKKLQREHVVISTIVTTPLLQQLCSHYHVSYLETLTGFKYIGEKMEEFEKSLHSHKFLFGAEESFGFLYGTHVHDKDAIIASCLLSEAALNQKLQGKTLLDLLYLIYQKFGVYQERQLSISLPDSEQSQKNIADALRVLRATPPTELFGQKLISISDYSLSTRTDLKTGKITTLALPQSNVLSYRLADESQWIVRPSGTEPKLKIYGMVHKTAGKDIPTTIATCQDLLVKRLACLKTDYLHL
jgi:phosphomannomutase